ncbi:MAG: 16S rRNA (guanine(527)-N(7))-methyltransferase RsmG [Butyricicoccus sp.]
MNERQTLEQGLGILSTQSYPQTVDNLLKFSELLLEKNKVMNLTAVTDPMEVVTRHFLDCAVLAPRMISGEKVLDVGTGAGFPGLPLAILCPETEFVLIDALRKRMDFLNDVIAALGLKNVQAIHARAEEFAREHRAEFDCAVSRAVADLSVLSELTLPLVKTGGVFYAMKAHDCAEEVQKAAKAVEILGGDPARVEQYEVPVSGIPRAVVCIRKSRVTPAKYPRRFAKISAAPLGGK